MNKIKLASTNKLAKDLKELHHHYDEGLITMREWFNKAIYLMTVAATERPEDILNVLNLLAQEVK